MRSEFVIYLSNVTQLTTAQAASRAPLDIKSAKQWTSKQRMAAKIYASVPEHGYTQRIAQARYLHPYDILSNLWPAHGVRELFEREQQASSRNAA